MSKYIGDVSAYAYAVSKGYTGTEEEFAELMASYADVGQTAVDAKDAAVAAKTAAQTAATTATNKASEATTAATTAINKASEAQTSAQTASTKASEASTSAQTASQKATESAQSATNASQSAQTAEQAKTDAQTAKTQAETARDNAVTAKTAAETAQAAAESVAESIPSDYSQLSEDVSDLKEDLTSHGTAIESLTNRATKLESKVTGIDVSVNRLNPFTITSGYYINMAGTRGKQLSLMYTDYIRVKPGDIVYLVKNGVNSNAVKFRYVTAYDSEKVVISASGKETSWTYTVPDGVYYIIMTLYIADYEGGGLAININGVFPYTAYNDAADIVNYAKRLERYPYTTLPDYVLGGAWYKPLGSLSKGYFCFVADDGRIGMNEYTIPTLVIGKGVKCTFAIMSASEVMADAEKIAVVKDAVDNYGCSVAQHGGKRWTSFDEYHLNEFFDTEKAFFHGIGIEVRGAVIPEHYNSQLIYAVAGGKYGVVRSGYNGHIYPTVCQYGNYSNGPRSNLYGLTSYNIVDLSLANNKAAVDYAIANHYLMIVYIHENSLDDAKKAVIEGLMDYVNETGITQITLGDIPNLI